MRRELPGAECNERRQHPAGPERSGGGLVPCGDAARSKQLPIAALVQKGQRTPCERDTGRKPAFDALRGSWQPDRGTVLSRNAGDAPRVSEAVLWAYRPATRRRATFRVDNYALRQDGRRGVLDADSRRAGISTSSADCPAPACSWSTAGHDHEKARRQCRAGCRGLDRCAIRTARAGQRVPGSRLPPPARFPALRPRARPPAAAWRLERPHCPCGRGGETIRRGCTRA